MSKPDDTSTPSQSPNRGKHNSPKGRRAWKIKIHTLHGKQYSVSKDHKLYELRKSGNRRIKGMQRITILRALFPPPPLPKRRRKAVPAVGQ